MTVRTEKIAGQIQQEIAQMLLRGEVRDPRLSGLISVTSVEISRDLQQAHVRVSVMGGTDQIEESSLAALRHAAGFLQNQLGRRLRLRNTPHLIFSLDRSMAEAERMAKILADLHIPPAEEGEEKDRES
ncbi:MAG: 30S ribosome-binding factor RbfA [Magnetococcales bacterium]|nr:30S ribosome-binding factor RbfA [Magnetococcales bacterium]